MATNVDSYWFRGQSTPRVWHGQTIAEFLINAAGVVNEQWDRGDSYSPEVLFGDARSGCECFRATANDVWLGAFAGASASARGRGPCCSSDCIRRCRRAVGLAALGSALCSAGMRRYLSNRASRVVLKEANRLSGSSFLVSRSACDLSVAAADVHSRTEGKIRGKCVGSRLPSLHSGGSRGSSSRTQGLRRRVARSPCKSDIRRYC